MLVRLKLTGRCESDIRWLQRQTVPVHDLIHLGEEPLAVCLFTLAGVFETGKVIRLMGGSDRVARLYFSIVEDVLGQSLA